MSRLIVKNIPKQISEEELKSHFEKLGAITDCRILFKEKKNRRIAFIGYKSESNAQKAKEYFNNTYIYMSRINVDYAKTNDDPTLPRAWSKYSKGSSLYFSKHPEELKNKPQNQKKIKTEVKTVVDELIINPEKKAKFQEFLQLMSKTHNPSMTESVPMVEENKSSKKKLKKEKNKSTTINSNGNQVIITELDESNLKAGVSNKRIHIKLGSEPVKKEEINKILLPEKKIKESEPKKDQIVNKEMKLDEKRLYVINLPFNATEEDIRGIFEKYGKITELKMPKDREGKFKGFAYISYENETQALHAFAELENKIVMGRILHLRPSYVQEINDKTEKMNDFSDEKTSYKKSKKREMLEKLHDKTNWNSLFLNPNSVLSSIAMQYNLKKRDILNLEASDQAVKIAMAETQIIHETKEWLENQGLNLSFLEESPDQCIRSDKIILIKNLSTDCIESEVKELFEYYGSVTKFLLCPNNSIGIVEYESNAFAGNAFKKLSYYKFKGEPIYLEWAPIDILIPEDNFDAHNNNQNLIENHNDEDSKEDKILYVKNLNFKSSENDLRSIFKEKFKENDILSVKVIKKNGLSQGYGFVEFKSQELASKALKLLQNKLLDDHALKLSISKNNGKQKQKSLKRKREEIEPNNKIVVRNIAFEATKEEILNLFKVYGEVKNVRLPRKMDKQHRGFAFVEFTSIEEANKAFKTLQNTHLYGRKLVLEWAKEDNLMK